MMLLNKKAQELRKKTFETIYRAGGGHYGGSLSAIEIMTALYYDVMNIQPQNPEWEDRDRFVLCKGHAGPPLYVILSDLGFIDQARLPELDQDGGSLPKHVDRLKVQGIDYSSGPLGQGISVACGMAAAARLDKKNLYVYALLGDGELDEGQVWEAAMTASHYGLDHLIAFVDRNMNQIDGTTEDVMALEPLSDKWKAFGWHVQVVDGHDIQEITEAVKKAKDAEGRPSVIIANTIKGKGISFMENQYKWHSGQITQEQFNQGLHDLERG
ncbi:transketolase [Clostridium sp. AM58-1XD]|nr:transketolase [Clostridium sp. AM58-1XD]RGY98291.1 transketolase [Clostridium sp. AM58-1XD]